MSLEWIIIEMIAVFIDCAIIMFFLDKRFQPKYNLILLQYAALFIIIVWSLLGTFLKWPTIIYDIGFNGLLLAYLLTLKQGTILQKITSVLLVCGLGIAVALAGAGTAVFFTNSSYQQSLEMQDVTRLLSLIFIKMLQVLVFYVLAKQHHLFRNLRKKPLFALGGMIIINFICIFIVWYFIQIPDFENQQHFTHHILVWIAAGLLIHFVMLFVVYELFIDEEEKNIVLMSNLQRTKLEKTFFNEIDAMYSDMRNWRHDYKNNITALRVLINDRKNEEAIEYIDNISAEPEKFKMMLQTGNLVLDAVASSKLWLAQSKGIKVSVQVVYPKVEVIKNSDLCAIVGNLLDNALEACNRMGEEDGKQFIEFSILTRSRNIVITINNSFNGKIKRMGDRYVSLKHSDFHGIGLGHVGSIVEKYNGHIMQGTKTNMFETRVMLPLSLKEGD